MWQRISVKAWQACGLKSGLPTSLFSKGCLMGSLEFAHSLSGAAFLEITCLFTSLMGCLWQRQKQHGVCFWNISECNVTMWWNGAESTWSTQGKTLWELKEPLFQWWFLLRCCLWWSFSDLGTSWSGSKKIMQGAFSNLFQSQHNHIP